MAIDGLKMGNRARVYKRIVEQMVTDPTLGSLVKVWITGMDGLIRPRTNAASAIEVRLKPRLGPVSWYSPDAQLGNLQIEVEILVQGAVVGAADMLDVVNVWEAIENAFYPVPERPGDQASVQAARAKQLAFEQALCACGSHTGEIVFSQPATFDGAEGDGAIARGMMQVDVIRAFNP